MDGWAFWLTALVMGLHIVFALAEMLFWGKFGPRVLGTKDPKAIALTKPMAFNQGFYNLLVVAGLGWSLFFGNETVGICFLIFVITAGIVGWATAKFTIFVVQSVPAIAALAVILL